MSEPSIFARGCPPLAYLAVKLHACWRDLSSGENADAMPDPSDPLDDFITAAAATLDLPLEPAWRASVKGNLTVTLQHARLVDEFPLSDEAEPAAVFRA